MAAIDIDEIRREASRGSLLSREFLLVETVERTGSTNRDLIDAVFGSLPFAARLLAAEHQSSGRGRRGRHWLMEPGRSAAFSIAIERFALSARPAVGLSIAVGVAIAGALATLAPDVRLKWPNDLQRAGRKFGGILVESRRGPVAPTDQAGSLTSCPAPGALSIERFVIGVGLNLLAPRDPQDRIGQPATGLFENEASSVRGELVIGRVAAAVVEAVALFLEKGLLPFRDDWDRLDALRGEQVESLQDGRIDAVGIARGIDGSGALRLETATGMQTVTSGDVSVRAVQAARQLNRAS